MDSTEKVLIFLIVAIVAFLVFAALTYAEVNIMNKAYKSYSIGDLEIKLPKTCERADVYEGKKLIFQIHTQDRFVINQVIGIYHKAFEDGILEGMKRNKKDFKKLLSSHNLDALANGRKMLKQV